MIFRFTFKARSESEARKGFAEEYPGVPVERVRRHDGWHVSGTLDVHPSDMVTLSREARFATEERRYGVLIAGSQLAVAGLTAGNRAMARSEAVQWGGKFRFGGQAVRLMLIDEYDAMRGALEQIAAMESSEPPAPDGADDDYRHGRAVGRYEASELARAGLGRPT